MSKGNNHHERRAVVSMLANRNGQKSFSTFPLLETLARPCRFRQSRASVEGVWFQSNMLQASPRISSPQMRSASPWGSKSDGLGVPFLHMPAISFSFAYQQPLSCLPKQ